MPPVAETVAGRTALITGAGSGIGRAIALRLVSEGARVVLVGRSPGNLGAVAAEAGPDRCRVDVCDVADPGAVDRLAAAVAGETISILVNNAGIAGPTRPLVDITPEEWDDVFATNVRGTYLMCRAFLPGMVARGAGDVINLASVSGKRPLINRTPYVSSKLAIVALTATLAFEVGPAGVTVNSLSPGPVRGDRMATNFRRTAALTGVTTEAAEEEFVSRAALHRLVEEDEVAQAVVSMLAMPGLCGADIDLSAGMIAR
jgi:NAD(P)-dependent dehydrogenase (short-subunit alcohol dehydrogenase family)